MVPAGCLDTEIDITPTARIYTSSQSGWSFDLSDVPDFSELPAAQKEN
jgi:hypothetical protein